MTDADLARAARAEADSRDRHYPALVASRKMTAEEATVDFQAWSLIAHWLETGRFLSGNIDAQSPPDGPVFRTVVEWLFCEDAVARAIAKTTQAQAKATGDGNADKATRLAGRLAALHLIAAKVTRQRRTIQALNQALRERGARQQQKEIAA